jgi:hypothetical protein
LYLKLQWFWDTGGKKKPQLKWNNSLCICLAGDEQEGKCHRFGLSPEWTRQYPCLLGGLSDGKGGIKMNIKKRRDNG